MKDVIPFIFWPWFLFSCGVLLRRRFASASRGNRPTSPADEPTPPTAPTAPTEFATLSTTPGAVAVIAAPLHHIRSRTLADALDGIAMPCDLAPLMGTGVVDPLKLSFFTCSSDAASVGSALSDELERLGYALTAEDDRSIRAHRGDAMIRAKLLSAELSGEVVMTARHPSAPADALVVELELG